MTRRAVPDGEQLDLHTPRVDVVDTGRRTLFASRTVWSLTLREGIAVHQRAIVKGEEHDARRVAALMLADHLAPDLTRRFTVTADMPTGGTTQGSGQAKAP